jgi:hypothetical protein
MSYDLFFRSRPSERPINAGTFREYFGNRRRYDISAGSQAWYSNDDTGVYFGFDLSEPGDDPDLPAMDATFNMNFYRPHIFGLEAETEVTNFIATFNPILFDGQTNGMSEGPYSKEGFLNGWNTGNRFGYYAIGQQNTDSTPCLLASAVIERAWRWNLGREARQQQVGRDIFIPKIAFLNRSNRVVSFVVWGDLMPIHLPEVDLIMVARDSFAPEKLFRRKPDYALAAWAELLPLIESTGRSEGGLNYYKVDDPKPSTPLQSWIRALPAHESKKEGVAVDQILDLEIWNESNGVQNSQ